MSAALSMLRERELSGRRSSKVINTTARLLSAPSTRLLTHGFKGGRVTCLAFAGADIVVGGTTNGNLLLWKYGSSLGPFSSPSDDTWLYGSATSSHSGLVERLVGRGNSILSASHDRTLRKWDLSNSVLSCTSEFFGHSSLIMGADVNSSGDLFASCSMDSTVRLWHSSQRQEVFLVRTEKRPLSVSFVDGHSHLLVTADCDGAALWDVRKHDSFLDFIQSNLGDPSAGEASAVASLFVEGLDIESLRKECISEREASDNSRLSHKDTQPPSWLSSGQGRSSGPPSLGGPSHEWSSPSSGSTSPFSLSSSSPLASSSLWSSYSGSARGSAFGLPFTASGPFAAAAAAAAATTTTSVNPPSTTTTFTLTHSSASSSNSGASMAGLSFAGPPSLFLNSARPSHTVPKFADEPWLRYHCPCEEYAGEIFDPVRRAYTTAFWGHRGGSVVTASVACDRGGGPSSCVISVGHLGRGRVELKVWDLATASGICTLLDEGVSPCGVDNECVDDKTQEGLSPSRGSCAAPVPLLHGTSVLAAVGTRLCVWQLSNDDTIAYPTVSVESGHRYGARSLAVSSSSVASGDEPYLLALAMVDEAGTASLRHL